MRVAHCIGHGHKHVLLPQELRQPDAFKGMNHLMQQRNSGREHVETTRCTSLPYLVVGVGKDELDAFSPGWLQSKEGKVLSVEVRYQEKRSSHMPGLIIGRHQRVLQVLPC